MKFNEQTTADQIAQAPLSELVDNAQTIMIHCTPAVIEESLVRVWVEGTGKYVDKFLNNLYNNIEVLIKQNGGTLDVAAGASDQELTEAMTRAHWRVCQAMAAKQRSGAPGSINKTFLELNKA